MVKAYSYARFSRKAQAEGDSLRRQLSAAYAYAEEHGLELDTTLQDHGVSAFTGANRTKGALKAFLDRVDSGEIEQGSFLLIDSMDRLSREAVVQATSQLLMIAVAGITVVTLNDKRRFDQKATMADVMLAVVEIERSHRESAEKSRKVREAHAESKRKAREEGRVWHRSGPTWLTFNESTGKFDEIPDKVRIVKRMFDLCEEGLGTTAIAQRFNADIEPTPKGNGKLGWHHTAILETLKNPAVMGYYQPRLAGGERRGVRRPVDGEPIPDYYPVIISKEQFYRVQGLIQKRNSRPFRGNGSTHFANLFVGLCVCTECKGTVGLHSQRTTGNKSALQCVGSRRGLCKAKKRFPYHPIEDAILRHVREFVPPSESRVDPLGDKIAVLQGDRDALAAAVETLEGNLEDPKLLPAAKDRLTARYNSRVSELEAKEAELAAAREEHRRRGVVSIPLRTRQEALQRLLEKMAAAEGDELYRTRAAVSAAMKGVIDRIWVNGTPDEVHANGMTTSEAGIQIVMAERVYLMTDPARGFFAFNLATGGDVTVERIPFDGSEPSLPEPVTYPEGRRAG